MGEKCFPGVGVGEKGRENVVLVGLFFVDTYAFWSRNKQQILSVHKDYFSTLF